MSTPTAARRFLVPEVVQVSAMDCGPAALKALLEGFDIHVSYDRLRELCQTDLDGTSIDTIEELAVRLGLHGEQVMIPADHLLLPEAHALPGILVVRHPDNFAHFVVVWRHHRCKVQIMDPATGRRWLATYRLLEQLYRHRVVVPSEAWRAWAASDEFIGALRRRLTSVGVSSDDAIALIESVLQDPGWRPMALLDASTRMVDQLVRVGGLARRDAHRMIKALAAGSSGTNAEPVVPDAYWSVRAPGQIGDMAEELVLEGAVVVRVRGRRMTAPLSERNGHVASHGAASEAPVAAARENRPTRPGRDLLALLRADGVLGPGALTAALVLAAIGLVVEAVLFRSLFALARLLGLGGQQLTAAAAFLVFLVALLILDLVTAAGLARLGRRLEARLRLAFLAKLPRLGDRYFQSRLVSDMAERAHNVHALRLLPSVGGELLRASAELALTVAGIAWLDPPSAPLAVVAAAVTLGVPLVGHRFLAERDLRERTHAGALSRFYLDALLGLVPIRTHGAERNIRRCHERLCVEWARAGLAVQRVAVGVETIQSLSGFALAAWLVIAHLGRGGGETAAVLLLVYWTLNLPVLGQKIALLARQYPGQRSIALRLMEPLGAPEDAFDASPAPPAAHRTAGVALRFESVSVRVAGHTILEGIDLVIAPGSHVAIVGPSGAGKSSLVGVLLGWYRPSAGRVLVNDAILDAPRVERLRRETAWVDPAVQLWNRPLLDNLLYGVPADAVVELAKVIERAGIDALLEGLPEGLQSRLGESGRLTSGGEGQRVRFARATLRPNPRLVILDEPFRGLDRAQRRCLLAHARWHWHAATLLCITHDVGETLAFERVLVMEDGRLIEDGAPAALAADTCSRYHALLASEASLRAMFRSSDAWRVQRLEGGRLAAAELDAEP